MRTSAPLSTCSGSASSLPRQIGPAHPSHCSAEIPGTRPNISGRYGECVAPLEKGCSVWPTAQPLQPQDLTLHCSSFPPYQIHNQKPLRGWHNKELPVCGIRPSATKSTIAPLFPALLHISLPLAPAWPRMCCSLQDSWSSQQFLIQELDFNSQSHEW